MPNEPMTMDEALVAINASGVSPGTLTSILVGGGLLVRRAALDAAIQNARDGAAATLADVESTVQALLAQRAALDVQINTLLGS